MMPSFPQNWLPDEFFTATQQQRLKELMVRWRIARDTGQMLAAAEQEELKELVEAELVASAKSAKFLKGE